MAKAVSTLVSITLLIAADRAAEYWQRTHARIAGGQPDSNRAQMEAALTTKPVLQFLPTNPPPESNAVSTPEKP